MDSNLALEPFRDLARARFQTLAQRHFLEALSSAMRAAGNAAGAARELNALTKRADGSVTTPRGDKPSPRSLGPPPVEAAASFSAPVHVDDALAKRVKTALTKRIAVVQACPDAGLVYSCMSDSQDALAANRGELITLRANYKELYDICESWHEKCDALTAAAEAHAEEPQWRKEAEQTLAAAEAFQKKQRLQIEALQQSLAAAEQTAKEAVAKEAAAKEEAASAKRVLSAARDELTAEQKLRASQHHAAQVAAQEAEAAAYREKGTRESLLQSGKEKLEKAEAKVKELEERLQSYEVGNVKKMAEERELAAAMAAMKSEYEGKASEQATKIEGLEKEVKVQSEQIAHLQQSLRDAAEKLQAEVQKREEAAKQAAEVLAGMAPAREQALKFAADSNKRAEALEAQAADLRRELQSSKSEIEQLQRKLLSTPTVAPPPPPPAAAPAPAALTPAESEFRALKNELDGWKLAAETSEAVKEKRERELKQANKTIEQLRAAAAATRGGAENKENDTIAETTLKRSGSTKDLPLPPRSGSAQAGSRRRA